MKKIVVLLACFTAVLCDTSTSQETPQKSNAKTTLNTIPSGVAKQEQQQQPQHQQQPQYYQPIQQQVQQYIPVQFIPKPMFVQQNQQPAMLIIAQPALVPQQMLYSNAAQHLLSYFHNNPQARYQLLHQYQPHPTVQPYFAQNPSVSSTVPQYQYVHAPQVQVQQQQQQHQQQSSGVGGVHYTTANIFNQPQPQYSYIHPQFAQTGGHQSSTATTHLTATSSTPSQTPTTGSGHLMSAISPQSAHSNFGNTQQYITTSTQHLLGPNQFVSNSAPSYVNSGRNHYVSSLASAGSQHPHLYQDASQYLGGGQSQSQSQSSGTTRLSSTSSSTKQESGPTAFGAYGSFSRNAQPVSLNHISSLAHATAQNFIKNVPPIIAGLEQFSPEQQAQIKAQLSSHLISGTPITPISSNHIAGQTSSKTGQQQSSEEEVPQYGAKLTSQTTQLLAQPQYTNVLSQQYTQLRQGHQLGHLEAQQQSGNGNVHQQQQQQPQTSGQGATGQQSSTIANSQHQFSSSQEDKSDSNESSSNFTPSVGYRTQYTKG